MCVAEAGCVACRAHFNLGNLTPGETADLWLDIGVPKKSGSQTKGRERKRDKVLGFFTGAKGNQEKDVEDCRVHIQARLSPLLSLTTFPHFPTLLHLCFTLCMHRAATL